MPEKGIKNTFSQAKGIKCTLRYGSGECFMQFLIHSRKTNQFLWEAPSMYLRASWHENMQKAKKYDTPTDAAKVLAALSETSKSHIVLWDGIQLWNVSESKA